MRLTQDLARRQLPHCLTHTNFDWGHRRSGKVRDVYKLDEDRLAIVTTDRISAFDHVFNEAIPFKGQVLNRLAAYFFERTRDAAPNHVLSVPHPNVTIARACEPLPIEFVVRGYLAGHAWRTYNSGKRMLCGAALAEGLRENEQLPEHILTPTTKASEGHDEDISPDEIISQELLKENEFTSARDMAFRLFRRGSELAAERGLILVDTKYEFGRTADGEIIVIDEIHTPDSSRYFYSEGYAENLERGLPQRQLSKEFLREWLLANGFDGRGDQLPPTLPDDLRVEISLRYAELFETLTGQFFEGSSQEIKTEHPA